MKTIRELLTENGFETKDVHKNIMDIETDCCDVRETGRCSAIFGYDLTGGNTVLTVNLEDNEFAPFVKTIVDEDNMIIKEIGYDTDLDVLYVYDY